MVFGVVLPRFEDDFWVDNFIFENISVRPDAVRFSGVGLRFVANCCGSLGRVGFRCIVFPGGCPFTSNFPYRVSRL